MKRITMIIRFSNHGNPFLCKSTSCSSLRAPTRNPFNIGKILGIPGQARDDGRWTILLNLLTLLDIAFQSGCLDTSNNLVLSLELLQSIIDWRGVIK